MQIFDYSITQTEQDKTADAEEETGWLNWVTGGVRDKILKWLEYGPFGAIAAGCTFFSSEGSMAKKFGMAGVAGIAAGLVVGAIDKFFKARNLDLGTKLTDLTNGAFGKPQTDSPAQAAAIVAPAATADAASKQLGEVARRVAAAPERHGPVRSEASLREAEPEPGSKRIAAFSDSAKDDHSTPELGQDRGPDQNDAGLEHYDRA